MLGHESGAGVQVPYSPQVILLGYGVIGSTRDFGSLSMGSSPVVLTIFGVVAQLARASALQAEGRGFESHPLHKNTGVFGFDC